VAFSNYTRLRAARFQAGHYRNMSADWGRPEARVGNRHDAISPKRTSVNRSIGSAGLEQWQF
jgi:hypothetical protein